MLHPLRRQWPLIFNLHMLISAEANSRRRQLMTKRDILTAERMTLGYQPQTHVTDGETEITEKPNPPIGSGVDEKSFGYIAQERFGKQQ